jgi:hypothetical protein
LQRKHEQHLCRPASNAGNLGQELDNFFVGHIIVKCMLKMMLCREARGAEDILCFLLLHTGRPKLLRCHGRKHKRVRVTVFEK